MEKPKTYLFALVGAFSHLAFANAVEPLRIANRMSGRELYRWALMSENGTSATASNGTRMMVDHGFDAELKCDALFVVTGNDVYQNSTKPVLSLLRRARVHGITLGTFCSGAILFAKAGFLEGRKAALHWEFHPGFEEEFPNVNLVPGVFVADGPFMTASGGHAAADMLLHMIARDHGADLAFTVSDQMVCTAVRDSNVDQRISLQARAGMRVPKLAKAMSVMQDMIEMRVSCSEIAAQSGLSVRQLERLFSKYLQTTPKKYLTKLRLDRARQLLVQTEMSVMEVSVVCGFANSSHFSRSYLNLFGVRPAEQRSVMT